MCSFARIRICAGKPKSDFLSGPFLGLLQTDAKILCLLPVDAPCREEVDAQLAAAGRSGQVEFVDPASPLNAMDERLHSNGRPNPRARGF